MKMFDAEGLRDQLVLKVYDVAVPVVREACLQSIARFAGLPMTHVIGDDEVVTA